MINAARPGAFDLRAHLVQEIREIDDLGFARGSFDHGCAVSQHRRHHYVVGAENSRTEFAAHVDLCPAQFRREHFYVAALNTHCSAERFETFQMQIDRPITNDATTGQRDGRFLAPAQ